MRAILLIAVCALAIIVSLLSAPLSADTTDTQQARPDIQALLEKRQYDQLVNTIAPGHYLHELIQSARRQKLHADPTWIALLHYKSGWWNDFVSEVDGEDFFLSDKGKTDPQAELEATLASFFSGAAAPPTSLTAQCRFRARFFWLNQQLRFRPDKMALHPCPEYQAFHKEINTDAISVIFPNSDPNNPSAMMGHTLIRFDKKGQTEQTRMLSHSVNYAAMVGDAGGLAYAWNGVVGGFEGRFGVIPYYLKLREYRKIKNRDIWEYQLGLDKEQIDFVIMHIYELQPSYFDYYFFSENCSYHVLSLLDVTTPKSRMTDQLKAWVTPVDTLKLLDERRLIKRTTYYPAPQTVLRRKLKRLATDESEQVLLVARVGIDAARAELEKYAPERQAAILELAYDYSQYQRMADGSGLVVEVTGKERKLLLARGSLKIKSPADNTRTFGLSPERGHDTSRVTVGLGALDNKGFMQLGWRGAYHDFLDPTPGFILHNQVEIFGLGFRYEEQEERLDFDEFKILDIISLAPRDRFFQDISWRMAAGWENTTQSNRDKSVVFKLTGGGGLAYEYSWPGKSVVYGFADIALNYGSIHDQGRLYQAGFGAGILSEINSHWKLHLSGSRMRDTSGQTPDQGTITLEQNFTLGKDLSLRLTFSRTESLADNPADQTVSDEAILGLNFYH